MSQVYRVGVLNDLHLPFGDPEAVEVTMRIFKDCNVDEILINGDLVDFYSINAYGPKHPEVIHNLEDELITARIFLETMRKEFPNTKIHYIYGNHEDRLERFILKHTKVFHNILRIENQLMLENLDITWQPYNSYYELIPNILRVQHSPPSYGVNGARTSLLKKMDCSYIWGCTHRQQHSAITTATGRVIHAYFNGWLGSSTLSDEHKRVFSYAKGHENWQQCASVVDICGEDFQVHQFGINNGKAMFNGKLYEV